MVAGVAAAAAASASTAAAGGGGGGGCGAAAPPSAQEYATRHALGAYLQDATALALESRPNRPLEALAEYFERVARGEHVWGRAYAYVALTPRNRLAFCDALRAAAEQLDAEAEGTVSREDCAALARLLCADFPAEAVARAHALAGALGGGRGGSRLASHAAFADALRTALPLAELLDALERALWRGERSGERVPPAAVLRALREAYARDAGAAGGGAAVTLPTSRAERHTRRRG